jgi:hypothetical protein
MNRSPAISTNRFNMFPPSLTVSAWHFTVAVHGKGDFGVNCCHNLAE